MGKKCLLLTLCLVLVCGAAWADEPFRNHRYDAFKVLEVTSENIVFVGNSITNMHPWGEAFGNPKILNRGTSGTVTDEALENLESVITGKPAKIFLMIGTNDLGTSGINTASHVAGNVRAMLKRIQKESPATEVYVQSILPSSLRDQTLQAETNDSLRNICTEMGITYIDLWDLLSGIPNGVHTLDRLHLSASGYRIWCNAIADYVGSTCVYADTATNKTAGLTSANGMRVTYFGMLPVKDGDVLMIGDEMVNGGEWQELLHCDKVLNRGMAWGYPGPNISTVLAEIPVILKGQAENGEPSQIYLYVGASDVNDTSNELADIQTNYESLVEKVRGLAPNATIYVMSLLPTATASTNTNRVVPFNALLKELAVAHENVEYVDCYTDLVSGGVGNSNYFTGNYLYGRGYAKLSQIIAPLIGEDATPTTDEDAEGLIALLTARNAIGNAITTVESLSIGDGVGQYTAENVASLYAEVDTAYALLSADGVTVDELTAEAEKIEAMVEAVLPLINRPTASTDEETHWYQIYAPLRGGLYVSSTGVGEGVYGETAHNYADGMWKFVVRADGDFDIVNRADSSYISPASSYNTQINTSATSPSAGWTLSYSSTPGYFIISSGKVQLNQTQSALSYAIYNWSSGNTGTDRSDNGCQFVIADAAPLEEEPVAPEALLTLTDIELDGTAPYRLTGEQVEKIMATNTVSVAIDFTPAAASSSVCTLVGSSAEEGCDFFALIYRDSNRYGVQYIGDNDLEGWYTQGSRTFTSRTQVVLTMDGDNEAYNYYYNGTFDRTVQGMGAYGYRSFGNVPGVTGLFLGGLITADASNKYPFAGTVHSVRFWTELLSEAEVGVLEYDGLVPTGIEAVVADGDNATAATNAVYDLSGRRVNKPSKGFYIVGGQKKILD
ncbi:MAG: GDSL-type esterase/lipase family protein [Bacteroidales bacterium]|nr:GDSL-type esterase/lipase family protein [Bacteroidales bacterium]